MSRISPVCNVEIMKKEYKIKNFVKCIMKLLP